jgi:hypothetical protein
MGRRRRRRTGRVRRMRFRGGGFLCCGLFDRGMVSVCGGANLWALYIWYSMATVPGRRFSRCCFRCMFLT